MRKSQEMTDMERAYLVRILYKAGSDTTTLASQSFVLAALAYSNIVREVQKQPDESVDDKLPSFDHRGRFAIVDAVAKATLRWRPVSAGGISHEYMGYHTPAGPTVIANHGAYNMDESGVRVGRS